MLGTDETNIRDGEVLEPGAPLSGALVPVAQTVRWAPKSATARPDPSFLTHLIATNDHDPQTRSLRRGSVGDAQTAYGSRPQERRSVTRRTRQVI